MLQYVLATVALMSGQTNLSPAESAPPAPAIFPSLNVPGASEQPATPPAGDFLSTVQPTKYFEQQPAGPEPVNISAPLLPALTPPPPAAASAPAVAVPDRWWLMRQAQGTWLGTILDDNRLFATGWFQQSFTASTDHVNNQPVVWNDRANQYLFQQGWFRVGRSVVTSGSTEPSFGFQIDMLTGSDYRFTLPRGLLNSQLFNSNGAQNLYGVDPIQHYVSMYLPTLFRGTEFRFGRVYTPWGVESLEGISNPLLSRSYAFNWSPPFTHCGLEALISFTPEWSSVLMLANGNDVYFGDPSEELRFVGNVKWTQPGGRNTVTLATSLGRGRFNPDFATPPNQTTVALATEPTGRNNFNAFDVVYTHTFSPVLSYNMEAIYGYQTGVPQAGLAVGSQNGFANWASMAHYLFYTYSPKWSAVLRYENFDDAQGQRTGFAGLYTAVTGGIQYRINKSMIVRPELRYDRNSLQSPFEGKHDIFTAASDLIIRW